MKIEHIALNVSNPVKMANWYSKYLGFKILTQSHSSPFAHFIADPTGNILLEIFRLPDAKLPNYKKLDPNTFHIGFATENIQKDFKKLIKAGSRVVSEITINSSGNSVAMLKDPWGLPIQLIKRVKKL